MLKTLIITAVLFGALPGCYGSNLETPLSAIYDLAKQHVRYDVFHKQKYSDLLVVPGFDFFNFTPTEGEVKPKEYYSLLKQNGVIKKISKYSTLNRFQNYDVFLFPTDQFLFYTVYMYNDARHQAGDGYFVEGFFFRVALNRLSFFVGINDGLLPVVESVDEAGKVHTIEEGMMLHLLDESTVAAIDKMMLLDEHVNPQYRLNYYENELLSNSEVKYQNEQVYEVLEFLPRKACPLKTDLTELTLSTLYDIINRQGCHSYFQAWVKPDYPNGTKRPLWSYNKRYYVYAPLECIEEQ